MTKTCPVCNEEYETRAPRQKYCSRQCAFAATGAESFEKYCLICGEKLARTRNMGWERFYREKKYCSSDCQLIALTEKNKRNPIEPAPPQCEKIDSFIEYHEAWAEVREAINKQKNRLGKAGSVGAVQAKITEQLRRADKEEIEQKYAVGGGVCH